jgi:hypothetical protein
MTLLVGLACLAVAGVEVFMAFVLGPRERAALRQELKDSYEERLHRLETAPRHDDLFETEHEARLRNELGSLQLRIAQTERDLTGLAEVQRRIGALEHDLRFEVVQGIVGDLLRHTVAELDQASLETFGENLPEIYTIRGAIGGADLQDDFERCALQFGLQDRFTLASGDGRLYYLSGRSPRWLSDRFLGVLRSLRHDLDSPGEDPAPDDVAALRQLLLAIDAAGRGFAQLGPLVVARTSGSLLCGVLTLAGYREFDTAALAPDSIATAVRLRTLPEHRFFDLTEWPQRFPRP